MNILIPDSWLKEHLKTKATPKQISEYLSLCAQSVEKVTRKDDDWIYEIEITTNRSDCLSVYGIARELAAILPRFGIKARLKQAKTYHTTLYDIKPKEQLLPLEVQIKNPKLCPRFTALIFDKVKVRPSPKKIQDRLGKSGIRTLNSVVDISNYLMLELGQPMHTFDYDKVLGAKMILRESAGGEKITTLDGEIRPLPDGAIIIEDGKARIIDLCGIMGGKNSEVDQKTKRVLLFVQTYDPVKIRQASQGLALRTEAASRFEKGVDPEGVLLAMKKAIAMFEKNCGAKIASKLFDIYPNPPKAKKIKLDLNLVEKIIGIEIPENEIVSILKSLGFSLITNNQSLITITVPHWRHGDISIPEDLIEEVARIYGYHKLPSALPPGEPPQQIQDPTFFWERGCKNALKYWGFTEVMSYSMIGYRLLKATGYKPLKYLSINNPLTSDLVYMRPSIVPSLLNIIAQNQAENEQIQIFELANVYLPKGKDKLPDEKLMLTGAMTGDRFFQLKGIVKGLLEELGIRNFPIRPTAVTEIGKIFHPARTAVVGPKSKPIGILGEAHPKILRSFGIKGRAVVFELDFEELVKLATTAKHYTPIPKYPAIVEDLAFVVPPRTLVGEMIEEIKKVSKLIISVELLDSYKNTRTFRITYQSPKKTLTDKEVEKIRKKIIEAVSKKFGAKVKGEN